MKVVAMLSLSLAFLQCAGRPQTHDPEESSEQDEQESRILGGEEAAFGQHSWQVALFRNNSDFSRVFCGGSLIDETHILTAAHCVHGLNPDAIIARLGVHDLTDSSEDEPYSECTIRRIVVQENYNPTESNITDDIALLELAEPVDFRMHVTPASLPHHGADFRGEKATVYGWGRIDQGRQVPRTLRRTDVRVMDTESCNKWLIAHGIREIRGSFLCSVTASDGYGPCKGDSGGPMILSREDRAQLIGIVSGSFGCGKPSSPIFYTEVSRYVEWITANIEARLGSQGHAMYDDSMMIMIQRILSRRNLKSLLILIMGITVSICILTMFPRRAR